MTSEKSEDEKRFAEIALKLDAGENLPADEIDEFDRIALKINARREVEEAVTGEAMRCVWICNNGFMCDPDWPPPNCNCHRVCY